MSFIDPELIDNTLKVLSGYKFTTLEFIVRFKELFPKDHAKVVDEYGVGGKGSGKHYSSNSCFAKDLANHKGENKVVFLGYIKAPSNWGNSVIALWEHNPSGIDTVRIEKSVEDDIAQIINDKNISETERESLVLSRIGQGHFRRKLISLWGKCSVTGCSQLNMLVASHIKPWFACNNAERLDENNGLLLIPNIDKLFDKGVITFENNGSILISKALSDRNQKLFGLKASMNIPLNDHQKAYMAYHRESVFENFK